jgi:hypothetical protein
VGENTVADRISEDSVELCQVGIERVHRRRTLLRVEEKQNH